MTAGEDPWVIAGRRPQFLPADLEDRWAALSSCYLVPTPSWRNRLSETPSIRLADGRWSLSVPIPRAPLPPHHRRILGDFSALILRHGIAGTVSFAVRRRSGAASPEHLPGLAAAGVAWQRDAKAITAAVWALAGGNPDAVAALTGLIGEETQRTGNG